MYRNKYIDYFTPDKMVSVPPPGIIFGNTNMLDRATGFSFGRNPIPCIFDKQPPV